ncbi:hypothetical protein MHU86_7125 [Fragilaria crotonensis]|nr:hypothetical protein MHU86_7125 [Fragilaria crotonensis]
MDEVSKAATDAGMTPDQGKTATGGVMTFLKHHVSKKLFKTIEAHMPGARAAVKTHTRGTSEGGGGTGLSGMFGGAMSAFGGKQGTGSPGEAADLMALLASKGISPTMVQQFLGKVGPLIQKKCGVDVTQCLGSITSAPAATATAATATIPATTAPITNAVPVATIPTTPAAVPLLQPPRRVMLLPEQKMPDTI